MSEISEAIKGTAEGTICGRAYASSPYKNTKSSHLNARTSKFRKKPQGRILVEGITKKNGDPIRFKSLEKAERHIKNFRLEK